MVRSWNELNINKKIQLISSLYLEREKGSKLDNPYILAIPGGMAKSEIHISKSGMFLMNSEWKMNLNWREYLLAYADLV